MDAKVTYTVLSNIDDKTLIDPKLVRVDVFDSHMDSLKFKNHRTGTVRMDTFINVSLYDDTFFIGKTEYKPLGMLTK